MKQIDTINKDKNGTPMQAGDSVVINAAATYEKPIVYRIESIHDALAICATDVTTGTAPAVKLTPEIAKQLIIVSRAE